LRTVDSVDVDRSAFDPAVGLDSFPVGEVLLVCDEPVAGPTAVSGDVPAEEVAWEEDGVREEPVGEEFAEESLRSASATPAVLPTHAPMPSATASAPIRPM
jgi:hypothetical protein